MNLDVPSETASVENNTAAVPETSRNTISEVMIVSATPEDFEYDSHGEHKVSTFSSTLASSEITNERDDPAREAPLPLTHQALQQHNFKSISADGKAIKNLLFDKTHMGPVFLDDVATNAATLAGHNAPEEQYSYPHRGSKKHFSIALANMDVQIFGADIGHQVPSVGHQGVPRYPISINDVNLSDHLPESECRDDHSSTKSPFSETSAPEAVLIPVHNSDGDTYIGIVTQFSS